MPDLNGVEATRQITSAAPKAKVIALSTYSDKQFVHEMLGAGAASYVVKATASEELLNAIRCVMEGKTYLSPDVATFVVDGCVANRKSTEREDYSIIGAREREVLQLLAEGLTSKQIGDRLNITVNTVESHRKNIMHKLDVHSIAELTKFAVRHGMTTP